jgi:hydrogenase expression/formation protein HypD
VLTPSAISNILESPEVRQWGTVPLDGFIGPAHVSTVIGSRPYEFFAEEYRKPVVIAGFEPLDVMQAILMLVRQVNEGRAEVENEFSRAVTRDGNLKAQDRVAEVFELRREFEWRGLSVVPYSALRIRQKYASFDAERASPSTTVSVPTTRPASAGRSCAASSGRRTARSSARCARRKIRSAPAWSVRKAPVPRTTFGRFGRYKDMH